MPPVDHPHWGYLDTATNEPLHPAARDAMEAALEQAWADPSRLYGGGRRTRMVLDNAREVVAAVVGCRADEVRFAPGGAAAREHAVLGVAAAARGAGQQHTPVVTSAVEHSAVLRAVQHLGAGHGSTLVGVDRLGRVDVDAFAAALLPADAPPPVLAALQAANHEVGTMQPVSAVADHCASAGVPLLVDAAALLGRLPAPTGWSLLTADAAQWGGPRGVGVLVVRHGTRWRHSGPDDELGAFVGGFTDVPAAFAAAAALAAVTEDAAAVARRQHELVETIRTEVARRVPDVEVVGDPQDRLPHVVTFSFLYADGEALVTGLDRAGFSVSSGSACTSSTLQPSHVLAAMGALTHGNVRVSLRADTTAEEVAALLDVLPDVVARVRRAAGADGL